MSLTNTVTKKRFLYLSITLFFIIFILIVFGIWYNQYANPVLQTPKRNYKLMVAKTVAAQEKGLGGRSNLPVNQGMLFWFPSQEVQCFWMKNMQFSLDMVWLNSKKQVVYTLSDVSPRSYPKTFCPAEPAQYVIELNAGQAAYADIHSGQTLTF